MSMISSQCDELRDAAKRGGLVVGLPQMLNEAADLILELRDDLQRANDAMRDAEHDESMAWDRVRKAEAESTKLREVIDDITEVVEACDPALVQFIAKRMERAGIEVDG